MTTDTMNDAPRFKVGFDGETEYMWRGMPWACRHHPSSIQKKPDPRLIGCVYGASCDNRGEFPPDELMEHFPGYRRAAYVPTGETYEVETTSGPLTVPRRTWQFRDATCPRCDSPLDDGGNCTGDAPGTCADPSNGGYAAR